MIPGRSIRFGKYDVTNMVDSWGYELQMIEDKEGNINSPLSTINVMRSGAANGTFNIPERKEKNMLKALIEGYEGDTFNKDYHQFPAILTFYDKATKEVLSTYVFANCTANKSSFSEPDEKKQSRKLTYNWKSEDFWQFEKGHYIYVDELTVTETEPGTVDRSYKLSKNIAAPETPILLCMVNYETELDYRYSVESAGETGYNIVLSDDVDIKAGDKLLVVYETDSTTML